MAAEALYVKDADSVDFVAAAALTSGQVIQLPDGRAGVVEGLSPVAAGDLVSALVRGVVEVAKTADINILQGGQVFWDRSADTATFTGAGSGGDFYMGFAYEDSLAAATTVKVVLNEKPNYLIDFNGAPDDTLWDTTAIDGSGTTPATIIARTKLAFDAVAEAAKAVLYPADTKKHAPIADGPIFEGRIAIYDIGDDAALDINFGLANESHDTDFDSVTEFVGFHLDGSALDIKAESDDGTTEVAATDTTVDAVDDTYAEYWIDCRDPADIQLYIDGVNVLPATVFKLNAATGPVFPIVHLEKTSNDTTADVRVDFLRLRTSDL